MAKIKGIFDVSGARNNTSVIAISDLRNQARGQLHKASIRLGQNQPQANGADSLLGGMILNMIGLGAIGHAIDASFGHILPNCLHDIPAGFLSSTFETACLLRDDKADMYRSRKLSDYPEGRRKNPTTVQSLNHKFNMASANDNFSLTHDDAAEVALMAEIIEMLDVLEKRGVSVLKMGKTESVYDTLKCMTKVQSRKEIFSHYKAPVRKAA